MPLQTRSRAVLVAMLLAGCRIDGGETMNPSQANVDPRYAVGPMLYANDFEKGTADFAIELEKGGTVETREGTLEIDVPAGCSVWLKHRLEGPVMIEYDVSFVTAGGTNDRLSDLNLFWMSSDARGDDFFAVKRSGQFADYNQLRCYYAGVGGNANTTTRFRRYIGDKELRPLRPEHDLTQSEFLLVANRGYHIRAVASGGLIQLFRDDQKLFELNDAEPYTAGYFGFRTVTSHQRIRNLKIHRLIVQ